LSSVKNAAVFLVTEPNPRPDILTPEFLVTFKTEFNDMVRERREGVAQGDEPPSFMAMLDVNGCDLPYRMFTILVDQYPQLKQLPQPDRSLVSCYLMKHCGLPGSSLL